MSQEQQAPVTRVEFGAWVEGTESRKDGKGLRKVWVSPAPAGTPARLGVFTGTRFVFALHADTHEECQSAMALLLDAAQALDSRMSAPVPAPAPAPAPAPTRKAPTPPSEATRAAAVAKARANKPAPSPRVVTPAPAPAKVAATDDMSWLDMLRA